MFDAVVEVVINGYPEDNGIGIELGDFITLIKAEQVGAKQVDGTYVPIILPVQMKKTGWIFLRDIPNTLTRVRVRAALLKSEHNFTYVPPLKLKDKKFKLSIPNLPSPMSQDIATDRYLNLTYSQLKGFAKHKLDNRVIVDGDF